MSDANDLERVDRMVDSLIGGTDQLLRDSFVRENLGSPQNLEHRSALRSLQDELEEADSDTVVAILVSLAADVGNMAIEPDGDRLARTALLRKLTDDQIGNYAASRSVAYALIQSGDDETNKRLVEEKWESMWSEIGERPVADIVRGALSLAMRIAQIRLAAELRLLGRSDPTLSDLEMSARMMHALGGRPATEYLA